MCKVWEKSLTGLWGCPKTRSMLQWELFKAAEFPTALGCFVLDTL